ncbi:MAG: hypothetical protein LBR51_02960 [Bacteroidales bacterium]|jgi:3-phosphoshikimate 1-carboxyvinyltransferase|nr:hypothetical protein [Bacteroidales bacterium]
MSKIIHLPVSKSLYIRYLIYTYATRGIILPAMVRDGEDVHTVVAGLSRIQEGILVADGQVTVIHVGDCGAAFRFLLPLLATTPGKWLLTGSNRLLQRPHHPLLAALREAGADISEQNHELMITGKTLHATTLNICCEKSSQYASALLLSRNRLGFTKIKITPPPEQMPSYPYLLMTEKVIEDMNNREVLPCNEDIERDWSAAAFWYGWTSLSEKESYRLPGLSLQSWQGDAIAARWFNFMGVHTAPAKNGISISKDVYFSRQDPLNFNVLHYPDLALVVACTAVCQKRTLTLHGITCLNLKESKRLDLLSENIMPYACTYQHPDKDMVIFVPRKTFPSRHRFYSHNDHRLAMAFALFSRVSQITIDNLTCTQKSYPEWLTYFIDKPYLSLR